MNPETGQPEIDMVEINVERPRFGDISAADVNALAGRITLLEIHARNLEKALDVKDRQIAALRERLIDRVPIKTEQGS